MKKLCILALAFCSIQCKDADDKEQNRYAKLKQLEWLLGTWHMVENHYEVVEHWDKINDTLFKGASYYIVNDKDTPEKEKIELLVKNDTLFYIPAVDNQNNGKEIPFKEKSYSLNEVIFENPQHDFPKLIAYKKLSDTNILAVVSAGERSIEFNYTKK